MNRPDIDAMIKRGVLEYSRQAAEDIKQLLLYIDFLEQPVGDEEVEDLVLELERLACDTGHPLSTVKYDEVKDTRRELLATIRRAIRAAGEDKERWIGIARRMSAFVPEWAKKDAGPGHDPTIYGTLTHEGDLKVIAQITEDLAAIGAARQEGK